MAHRKFRLYAPFEVIGEGKKKCYVRCTYITAGPDNTVISKTFPGRILEHARIFYHDMLVRAFFYSHSWKDRNDHRRNAHIELRPCPESEQPKAVA